MPVNKQVEDFAYERAYLKCAFSMAQTSKAERARVGCIIVKNRHIISSGINGTPPGWWTNTCENLEGTTRPEVIHAEANAINRAKQDGQDLYGASIYVTHSPCLGCSTLIREVGISRVVFSTKYRDTTGVDYLKNHGVEVIDESDLS